MKKFYRLGLITIAGIASMFLLTWGLYGVRDELLTAGYVVSPGTFLLAFLLVVGGAFSIGAGAAMREIKRLNASKSTPPLSGFET